MGEVFTGWHKAAELGLRKNTRLLYSGCILSRISAS